MNKKKVLIWGYYGANNFGDDLIFNALYEILNRNNQNLELFYTIKEAESAYKVDAKPVVSFGKNHSNKVVNFFLNLKIM